MASNKRIVRIRWWQQDRRCIWCGRQTWCRTVINKNDAARDFGIIRGQPGSKKALFHRMATAEHIFPRKLGGGNGVCNIVVACARCNHHRSADMHAFAPLADVASLLPKQVQQRLLNVVGTRQAAE